LKTTNKVSANETNTASNEEIDYKKLLMTQDTARSSTTTQKNAQSPNRNTNQKQEQSPKLPQTGTATLPQKLRGQPCSNVTHSNIERHANQHSCAPVSEKETAFRNENRPRNHIQNTLSRTSKIFFCTQRTSAHVSQHSSSQLTSQTENVTQSRHISNSESLHPQKRCKA
jgi:hypothetical protein